jgi:hypothetical protein
MLMAKHSVMGGVLVAIGVAVVAGCASQPASEVVSLDEKYFQREARNYLKFEHEGQTVYCQNNRHVSSLVLYKQCVTERALRLRVEEARLSRNAVVRGGPPYVATVPGG